MQKDTLPCFCFGPRAALLPSFGGFTGHRRVRPRRDERIYVIAGDEVIDMANGAASVPSGRVTDDR